MEAFQEAVGAGALRFCIRMLARLKRRRRAMRHAYKTAKQEAREYMQILEADDLWLGISRFHPMWHPWDAKSVVVSLLMEHRVLLRSLFLKYCMKGLRNPEKAFKMTRPQIERFIFECDFSAGVDKKVCPNSNSVLPCWLMLTVTLTMQNILHEVLHTISGVASTSPTNPKSPKNSKDDETTWTLADFIEIVIRVIKFTVFVVMLAYL